MSEKKKLEEKIPKEEARLKRKQDNWGWYIPTKWNERAEKERILKAEIEQMKRDLKKMGAELRTARSVLGRAEEIKRQAIQAPVDMREERKIAAKDKVDRKREEVDSLVRKEKELAEELQELKSVRGKERNREKIDEIKGELRKKRKQLETARLALVNAQSELEFRDQALEETKQDLREAQGEPRQATERGHS